MSVEPEQTCDGCGVFLEALRACRLWTDVCAPVPCPHAPFCAEGCEGLPANVKILRDDVYLLTSTDELQRRRFKYSAENVSGMTACSRYVQVVVKG